MIKTTGKKSDAPGKWQVTRTIHPVSVDLRNLILALFKNTPEIWA